MTPAMQDMFQLQCLIKNVNVKLCARIERGVKQLIALVTDEEDVLCYYSFGELPTVLKRISWYTSRKKAIKAMCFDPTATWLLVVSVDGSLHIIPFLSLVDKKQKVDCKWSTTDLTNFPKPPQCPDCEPTSLVWWQTLDCNQNGLIGFENGAVTLISLTDGRFLATCSVNEAITQLIICQDNSLDAVFLLIYGSSGQQWKHVLEQHSLGYIWPPDSVNNTGESPISKLYHLKQIGVDKLFSLKQRLVDGKHSKKDNSSDTTSESSFNSDYSNISGPELLPHLSDTYLKPQYAKDRFLFTAFYKPSNLLTVHAVDVEAAPLYSHKLPNDTIDILLTDKVIFTLSSDKKKLQLVSSNLSECRIDGESEFNEDSQIACFEMEQDEQILKLFKVSDIRSRKYKNKLFEMPKSVDELRILRPKVDTCVLITNKNVYKVNFIVSPVNKFIQYIMEMNDYDKAQILADVFDLNVQQLLECCGDLFISQESFHSGIILYKQAKVHLLKRVLKLAISADCKTLLKFVHLCLGASKVDMSVATKIHIGNLAVMAYTELILRYGGSTRIANIKDFMNFLKLEEFYDQILAVNVACQAAQWKIVNSLAKSRGLQPEVVSAFGQILQSSRAPKCTDMEFMYSLSEPSLTQSLLLEPKHSEVILKFIRDNVSSFPETILKRFIVQLDPSQPCAIPLVSRNFNSHKSSMSLESTLDSNENENHDRSVVVKSLIETFIIVLLHLVTKFDNNNNLKYLERIKEPSENVHETPLEQFPPIRPLSCGYEHAAIIRNDLVYTMGLSNTGCLGLGPLLSQSTPPRLVQTLASLNVKVISVSCGRKHTLFLTDYGVYACGSNKYGQLGLGGNIHISPYPQMIVAISHLKVIEVICGQYHSLALTSGGNVYTWGWGIHGQLGHGSCNNELYPKKMKFHKRIKQIAAGHAHSLILTEDGEIFGFGSNAFGQLENKENSGKRYHPIVVKIFEENSKPIIKISSAYFHNIAVTGEQEVYVWGASPQEIRLIQARSHQKTNGLTQKPPDSWKQSINIYSTRNKGCIEEISIGYRHSAILHNGKILWGKTKDGNLSEPHLRGQDTLNIFNYRFLHVSCGLDYTMAVDHIGRLLAWGSVSMAQTLLGRLLDDRKNDEKIIISRNTRRILRFPSNIENLENYPIEVPGLPSMTITFNPTDHRLIFAKTDTPNAIIMIENSDLQSFNSENDRSSFNDLQYCPKYNFGQKTLQYVLEMYCMLYDFDFIQQICLNVQNYQAASKVALIGEHYCDSLNLQLKAFNEHLKKYEDEIKTFFDEYERSVHTEKLENRVDLFKSMNMIGAGHFSDHSQQISTSSSLDSIRQWDEQEHQGGCESPCKVGEIGDVCSNMTQFVQSLKNNQNISPISCVSSLISSDFNERNDKFHEIEDENIRNIINMACYIVEFYIKKIHRFENHILMQNVLMQIIEFWLSSSFPVIILEKVLLKNLDKYFYPLSILLFCKDFSNESEDKNDDTNSFVDEKSARFLKEFSAKFCLQLCLMVVENVNKS